MVSAAPPLSELAAAVAERVDDRILVAHNLPFDARMLQLEFTRLGGALDSGIGFDTLRDSGCALEVACQTRGIPLKHHHRALADAHATAALMRMLYEDGESLVVATARGIQASAAPRTLRREAVQTDVAVMPRIRPARQYPTSDQQMLAYLDALNWVLDDAVIDLMERAQLDALARDLGLDPIETTKMHTHYVRQLVSAAMRDGIVTAAEHALLDRVSLALGVDPALLPSITPQKPVTIQDEMRGCFTGDAGQWSRMDLEAAAAQAGFQPVANVTKKGCDLLVAIDPSSQSGKAASARKWGIPIVSLSEFALRLGLE